MPVLFDECFPEDGVCEVNRGTMVVFVILWTPCAKAKATKSRQTCLFVLVFVFIFKPCIGKLFLSLMHHPDATQKGTDKFGSMSKLCIAKMPWTKSKDRRYSGKNYKPQESQRPNSLNRKSSYKSIRKMINNLIGYGRKNGQITNNLMKQCSSWLITK